MSGSFNHALLVEDEMHLGQALVLALDRMGIRATRKATLKDARAFLSTESPDLVILDRTLPDGDGIELCKEIRARGLETSILILTAKGGVSDRIGGLKEGADDYLAKPFSWEELQLRIQSLSRRKGLVPQKPTTLWSTNEKKLEVLGLSGPVNLTPLEFKLACFLIEREGDIVSRDELLKQVWGFRFLPKTRTVDLFMGRLRKHFESDPENPKHFLTVRGAGYRFQK